ncbi:MAG TPA: hypothetical protein VLT33_39085, partial [Labilithrix sp.]|nr:hypothetical protein [Labilithrix sp.]
MRYRRQKLFWTVIATGAAVLATSTMIVVSCLGRGHAQREVTVVETTGAPAPAPATTIVIAPVMQAPPATAPATAPATNDSTGGTEDHAAAGTTNVTSAPLVQRSITTAPTVMVTP